MHPFTVETQIARARTNRDLVVAAFRGLPRVRFEVPPGAFYLFFGLEGMSDSTKTVLRIIDEAGVGLAPGASGTRR